MQWVTANMQSQLHKRGRKGPKSNYCVIFFKYICFSNISEEATKHKNPQNLSILIFLFDIFPPYFYCIFLFLHAFICKCSTCFILYSLHWAITSPPLRPPHPAPPAPYFCNLRFFLLALSSDTSPFIRLLLQCCMVTLPHFNFDNYYCIKPLHI